MMKKIAIFLGSVLAFLVRLLVIALTIVSITLGVSLWSDREHASGGQTLGVFALFITCLQALNQLGYFQRSERARDEYLEFRPIGGRR